MKMHLGQILSWASLLILSIVLQSKADVRIIAKSGDPVPEGGGELVRFPGGALEPFGPGINDNGEVFFPASIVEMSTTGDNELFRGNVSGFQRIGAGPVKEWSFNDQGEAAFTRHSQTAIYRADATGVSVVAQAGDPAPGTSSTFASFGPPLLNGNGEIVFHAELEGGDADAGLFLWSSTSLLQKIALAGETAQSSGGSFEAFDPLAYCINENGDVIFNATLGGVGITPDNDRVIYHYQQGSLSRVEQTGQPDPNKRGFRIAELSAASLNDSGKAVFAFESTDGSSQAGGLALYENGTLTQLLASGDNVPNETHRFLRFSPPTLNNQDRVLFQAGLDTPNFSEWLFCMNAGESGTIRTVLRGGGDAPNGNGVFSGFDGRFAMNDSGNMVFLANFSNTSKGNQDDQGLYFMSSNGVLHQVVREGRPALDTTLTGLRFIGRTRNETHGLNNSNEVVFGFQLQDGREGVARWNRNIVNLVANGGFENDLDHWEIQGDGSVTIANSGTTKIVRATTDAPVRLVQMVNTPATGYDLAFAFRFPTTSGTLEVVLADKVVASLNADFFGPMEDFALWTVHLNQFCCLTNTSLEFRFDGPEGTQIEIDDVSIKERTGPIIGSTIVLHIESNGEEVTLSWEGSAVLQKASSIEGPYSEIPDAGSPYTEKIAEETGATRFYRLR